MFKTLVAHKKGADQTARVRRPLILAFIVRSVSLKSSPKIAVEDTYNRQDCLDLILVRLK